MLPTHYFRYNVSNQPTVSRQLTADYVSPSRRIILSIVVDYTSPSGWLVLSDVPYMRATRCVGVKFVAADPLESRPTLHAGG